MPNKELSSNRHKKEEDNVSLIVCTNASGTHNITCLMIEKQQDPTCIKDWHWQILYFNQIKSWIQLEMILRKSLIQNLKEKNDLSLLIDG